MPSLNWSRNLIFGQSPAAETPTAPVATTIIPTLAAETFLSSSQGAEFTHSISTAGTYGFRVEFTSNQDMSVYPYVGFQATQRQYPYPLTPALVIDTFDNGGISIVFFDSSGNWSEFNIWGSEYPIATVQDGGWLQYAIQGYPGSAPFILERTRAPDNNSGTLDWSAIAGFETIIRLTSTAAGASPTLGVGSIFNFDIPEVTGGAVADPADFDYFASQLQNYNAGFQMPSAFLSNSGNFLGGIASLYEPFYTYSIGDGFAPVYFRDSGSTLAPYPVQGTGGETRPTMLLAGADRGVIINQTATCDVEFDGTLFAAADSALGQDFIDVIGSPSGNCVFNNVTFYRKTYVNLAHSSSSGVVFDDCEQIEINTDTSLSAAIIRNSAVTSKGLYIQTAPSDYSSIDVSFANSNLGDDITINPTSSGAFDLSGVSVEAGKTLNLRNESATLDVDINIPSGIVFSTSTAGGAINIIQPATNVEVEVIGQDTNSAVENAVVYLEASAGGDLAVGTVILNAITGVSGVVDSDINISNPQPFFGRVRKASATPFYVDYPLAGTIQPSGFSATALLSRED